jgi:hypothetical protein
VFIFVPYSHYDEPKTLSYFMQPVCLLNADGGHWRIFKWNGISVGPVQKVPTEHHISGYGANLIKGDPTLVRSQILFILHHSKSLSVQVNSTALLIDFVLLAIRTPSRLSQIGDHRSARQAL